MSKNCLTFAIVCGLMLATSTVATAQESADKSVSATENPGIYEIKFDGGTIDEYVKLVRQMPHVLSDNTKEAVNIVVTESARDFQLPSIHVTTNPDGAIGIMEGCSTDNHLVSVEPDSTGNVMIVRVKVVHAEQVSVINAKVLLQTMDQETLLSAIEIGLEMLDASENVKMRLHEETGLLFIKGSEAGNRLVKDVIHELNIGIQPNFSSGGSGGVTGNQPNRNQTPGAAGKKDH